MKPLIETYGAKCSASCENYLGEEGRDDRAGCRMLERDAGVFEYVTPRSTPCRPFMERMFYRWTHPHFVIALKWDAKTKEAKIDEVDLAELGGLTVAELRGVLPVIAPEFSEIVQKRTELIGHWVLVVLEKGPFIWTVKSIETDDGWRDRVRHD